jgi:hypothetical protein
MAYIGNSPANVGNYQVIDDISGSFNGSQTSFALASGGASMSPAKSSQLIINISGVMQQPDDSGTNGFLVNSTNIVFSSAPLAADTFWGVYQGQSVDIGTPSDNVVDTAHVKDGAITAAKIDAAVELGGPSLGTSSIIRTNAQTISENITIPSTSNGMSAGPITIADTYTVIVNGNWTII